MLRLSAVNLRKCNKWGCIQHGAHASRTSQPSLDRLLQLQTLLGRRKQTKGKEKAALTKQSSRPDQMQAGYYVRSWRLGQDGSQGILPSAPGHVMMHLLAPGQSGLRHGCRNRVKSLRSLPDASC